MTEPLISHGRMPTIYVAGPFTAETSFEIEQNVQEAEAESLKIMQKCGIVALCPHSMYRNFAFNCASPEFWYAVTNELLLLCGAIAISPGWSCSRGTIKERDAAMKDGMPVFGWGEYEAINKWAEAWVDARNRSLGKYCAGGNL